MTKVISEMDVRLSRNNPRFDYVFDKGVPLEVDEKHLEYLERFSYISWEGKDKTNKINKKKGGKE